MAVGEFIFGYEDKLSAIQSGLFGYEKRLTRIGESIIVDVTEVLTTDLEAEVTKWPVERSQDISDHIKLGPVRIQIQGFISNAPLGGIAGVAQSVAAGVLSGFGAQLAQNTRIGGTSLVGTGLGTAVGARLGGALGNYLRGQDPDVSYPQKAMKALIDCYKDRKPFTIRTYFYPNENESNIYTNMVITALSFPQSVQTGDGLPFTLSAERIELVDLELKGVSGEFIRGFLAGNSAPPKADLGKQGTKPASEPAGRKASALLNTFRGLTGGL